VYYSTKSAQKAKARFSRLLRHTAWKQSGPILKGKVVKEVDKHEKISKE